MVNKRMSFIKILKKKFKCAFVFLTTARNKVLCETYFLFVYQINVLMKLVIKQNRSE